MEFSSPVYELMYLYESRGVRFPPYCDLMQENDILKLISNGIGERRGRKL
jgi:hypothetical protein